MAGTSGKATTGSGQPQAVQSDGFTATAARPATVPNAQGPVRSRPGSGSASGFIAQRLSQEALGNGLHIEPWQTALSSYRSAAALPASASPVRVASLSV